MRKLIHRPRGLVGRILFFAGGFVLAGAAAASAFFLVSMIYGAGNFALAQADSLPAPTSATATEASATSVTVNWTAPDAQLSGATYEVIRNLGPGQTTVCTVSALSCTDIGLKPGTVYNYSVVAVLDNWQSTAASASFATLGVTTTTLPDGGYATTYSGALAGTGGSVAYSWALAPGSTALPRGLTLSSAGAITGTPTAAGTTSGLEFTVTDLNGYSATSGNLSITVDKAPLTITASSTTSSYGTAPPILVTPGYSAFKPGDNSGVVNGLSCSSTLTAKKIVGTYSGANTCSGGSAANYSITYLPGDATVTKAVLTVTASSTSSTYGTAPTVTPGYAGFENSEDSTSFFNPVTCSSNVAVTTVAGAHPNANNCSGATAANYSFTYVPGDATVTRAPLTITAS
ncbi:MAG: MBG domain-containing protein, partial [Acidimicrobiales bacterium]